MVAARQWGVRNMKIGVIGANGNLGKRVIKQALDLKIDIKAFVHNGVYADDRVISVEKNLFHMERKDVEELDVLISTFGGGFNVDPVINRNAFMKYIELLENSSTQLIVVGGAGSLYTDNTHTTYEYETENHPVKLKEISKNIRLGIDDFKKNQTFPWTVVCPSRSFDLNGIYSGNYIVGTDCEIIYNEDHRSYVTYEDLAKAMLDIAENNLYIHKIITIASRKGGIK